MTAIPRVVLDTNVVFEGLTKQAGSAGLILEAWRAGLLRVCISDAYGMNMKTYSPACYHLNVGNACNPF